MDIGWGIRREFMALRNGAVADALRKGGMTQKEVYGLLLPQIKATAEKFRPESRLEAATMARIYWGYKDSREGRLFACYLMPLDFLSQDEATRWANDVATREEADIVAFSLIRHLPYASEIAEGLEASDDTLKKYTATAIRRFL